MADEDSLTMDFRVGGARKAKVKLNADERMLYVHLQGEGYPRTGAPSRSEALCLRTDALTDSATPRRSARAEGGGREQGHRGEQ